MFHSVGNLCEDQRVSTLLVNTVQRNLCTKKRMSILGFAGLYFSICWTSNEMRDEINKVAAELGLRHRTI